MRSSLLESVTVTKFQATTVYLSSELTKAKYSINILYKVEKENLHDDGIEVCNQYAHPNP
jgi:hypothetical protein